MSWWRYIHFYSQRVSFPVHLILMYILVNMFLFHISHIKTYFLWCERQIRDFSLNSIIFFKKNKWPINLHQICTVQQFFYSSQFNFDLNDLEWLLQIFQWIWWTFLSLPTWYANYRFPIIVKISNRKVWKGKKREKNEFYSMR